MPTEAQPDTPAPTTEAGEPQKHRRKGSQYLEGLWRRKIAILLAVMLIVGIVMVIASSRPTVYQATAEVLIQTGGVEAALAADGPSPDARRRLETEIRILGSSAVRAAAGTTLGGQPPAVSARPAGKADVIEVTARSGIASEAAEIANAYADAYVKLRGDQTAEEMTAAINEVQNRINELQKQIDAQPPSGGQARDALAQQQASARQQLDRLQVFRAAKTGAAEVVVPASVPENPVSPNPGRAGVIAALVGLLVAVAVALFVEWFDDSLRNKDDLERTLGLPVLGTIPVVGGWASGPRPPVVSLATPRSPATEAYRSLRTALQFAPDEGLSTIQLTSPATGDGKTTTLVNLGVAFARAGYQVALVCCDLRRPTLHELFGLTNEVGFTSVLLGKVPLTAALQEVPDQDRLYVLASGPLPPNPSELLASRRAREVLGSLRIEADIVLVDSPPVLGVSDALVVAGLVDFTVLVCAAGRTSGNEATRALESLRQVDAPLAGVVLNGDGSESDLGARYGYDSPDGAGPKPAAGPRSAKAKAKGRGLVHRLKPRPET